MSYSSFKNVNNKICLQFIYIYGSKVKFAIVVKSDQRAPFSIASALRYNGVRYFFP